MALMEPGEPVDLRLGVVVIRSIAEPLAFVKG